MIKRYSDFIDRHLNIIETQGNSELESLRNHIFAAVVKILIPLGFFIDLYNIVLAFIHELYLIVTIDILVFVVVMLIVFVEKMSMKFRRVLLLSILEILAIILILTIGQKGPGFIWLTGMTILATGIVGYRYGYLILTINMAVLIGIGCGRMFFDVGLDYVDKSEILFWFIVVSNYVIINSVCIFVMERLLKGLEKNIDHMVRGEEQLQAMYSSINEAIIITDELENITIMNYKASELTGYYIEEAKGRKLDEIYQVQRKDIHFKIGDKLFLQGVLTSKNHKIFEIEETITDIIQHNIQKSQKVYVFRDMTEYNRIENELRQMQKMQAVGQLASGVAHDFNNMLGGILGYAELIQLQSKNDPKLNRYSEMIINTTNRAADLTSQLLTFSRQDNRQHNIIDLHEALSSGLRLLERTIDPIVKIETAFYAKDILIVGDMTQLQNFILNLGINAKDAMPEGGRFIVGTQSVYLDEDNVLLKKHQKASGYYARIDIRDEGIGMEQEILDRIFEPFFTTKPVGKGTGLGLSSVYGAIKAHKGFVEIESKVNKGTTFMVYLPCLEPKHLNTDIISGKAFTKEN